MTEYDDDVATPAWIEKHAITFSRVAGYYESTTAWIKVSRNGRIIGAGVRADDNPADQLLEDQADAEAQPGQFTPTTIFEQIRRSTRTIRLLPAVGVRNRFCNWPDVIQNFYDAYGYTPARIKLVPTSRQISELDQVIDWIARLSTLGEEYPRIVWARAQGYSWKRIAYIAGLDWRTCKERFRVGINNLYFYVAHCTKLR